MRVVFFGTPAFAVPSLSALLASGYEVVAVVTQPDRPRGRSHSTLEPSPVKARAAAAGIPVLQPERPRDESFYTSLRELDADIGVVVAYGHLLRPELLAIPRFGCVNVHASLLPRWRGAAPIQWALLSGDPETGVTIMRVEKGLDTGAIWHERETAISDTDTTETLTQRLAELGAEALVEALPRVLQGAVPRPQDDVGMTHAPKIDREVARIRWDDSARAVSCRIRAMDPAPGAWTTLGDADVKLFGAVVDSGAGHDVAPGTIDVRNGNLSIQAGDGAVVVAEIQLAGKRRIRAAEWLHGIQLAEGVRFA